MGYHELSGTKLSLKKPLLVLKKKKAVQEEGSDSNNDLELEVIGVIRHKILFKGRPKALISSTFAPLIPCSYNVLYSSDHCFVARLNGKLKTFKAFFFNWLKWSLAKPCEVTIPKPFWRKVFPFYVVKLTALYCFVRTTSEGQESIR